MDEDDISYGSQHMNMTDGGMLRTGCAHDYQSGPNMGHLQQTTLTARKKRVSGFPNFSPGNRCCNTSQKNKNERVEERIFSNIFPRKYERNECSEDTSQDNKTCDQLSLSQNCEFQTFTNNQSNVSHRINKKKAITKFDQPVSSRVNSNNLKYSESFLTINAIRKYEEDRLWYPTIEPNTTETFSNLLQTINPLLSGLTKATGGLNLQREDYCKKRKNLRRHLRTRNSYNIDDQQNETQTNIYSQLSDSSPETFLQHDIHISCVGNPPETHSERSKDVTRENRLQNDKDSHSFNGSLIDRQQIRGKKHAHSVKREETSSIFRMASPTDRSMRTNKLFCYLFFTFILLNVCCVGPSEGRIVPCPFNLMCKCRYEMSRDDDPRSRMPTPIEVICIGVPFAKIPKLPLGIMDQVDVVNAGLEFLGNDDFDLTRIKNLRLMSNNIRKIGSKTFSEMGQTLLTLDLSYNALVDIPRDAMRHLAALEWLNLQGNEIAEVRRDDWNGLRDTLTSLFLGENNIDKIAPHVLTDFRKLYWVNLDDNNINKLERDSLARSINTLSLNRNLLTTFPSDTVSEFKDLTWLYLRGNLIDRLPERGFPFPKKVDRLDLGQNFISFIPNNLFNGSLSVTDLHFDFNLLTEIQENAFQGLNPSRLYLSANKIFNITDRAFMGGPEETIVMLDLEKNNLRRVPNALSFLKNLRYLYLPGNEITSISRNAFRGSCSKLEALSLSGNFLNTIPKEGLANCSKINHLNLGHNRIEQISPDDFESWGDSLETLVLRNNRLSSIPAHAFRYTPRLRELSLSFNRIVDVNPNSFIDILATLEILEISFGFYRDDFPEDVFKPLTSLQWIALDNNNFRTISETALYSFGDLSYFNMDSNRLTFIPKTLFHQNVHKKLVDIRLANNFIDELNTHTFHNLVALRTIVLTGNKIKKVYFEGFKTLPVMNTIAISNNDITEIENQAFSGLKSLTDLELQENHIKTFSLNVFANISATQAPLSLNLSHNEIVDLFPGSVGQYAMKSLDISHNHIKQVPVNFFKIFISSLQRLDIGYNRLTKLDTSAFGPLDRLQLLILEHNNIQQIRPGAFNNLRHVQLLDLSHNHLQALPHMCFSDMMSLRKIDFAHNHLRAFPPSVFTGTAIETLNFAYNEFVSMPTAALSLVESTLHYLDISQNHLEHLDSTMFNSFSNLIELNLASNKLTILPDNVFVSLRNLVNLDISQNTVRANFKELFHYTQNIQKLNLAKIGFTASPTIPLPNLVFLNMSHNGISDIEVHSVVSLRQLRTLDLSHNQITHVHSRIWPYLPYLNTLDLSQNPIKALTKDSFMGATRIETLILKDLNDIMRFDYDTLSHMGFLKELYMNTFPNIEKYRFRVGQLLATVHTLRTLYLEVREDALTDQLSGAFGPKLKELHITGANLKAVDSKSFRGFQNKHELLLSITDTSIESLPDGLLTHLSDVAYLSLDLRRNKLKFLNSQVLYGNKSDWESKGTTFVAGGLALQGNDWTCDCSLVWLGRWLRRWLRETLQIHTAVLKKAQQVDQLAREAVCFEPTTGKYVPLLDLRSEDMSCHASALSDTAHTSGTAANAPILPALLFLTAAQTFFLSNVPRRLSIPAAALSLVLVGGGFVTLDNRNNSPLQSDTHNVDSGNGKSSDVKKGHFEDPRALGMPLDKYNLVWVKGYQNYLNCVMDSRNKTKCFNKMQCDKHHHIDIKKNDHHFNGNPNINSCGTSTEIIHNQFEHVSNQNDQSVDYQAVSKLTKISVTLLEKLAHICSTVPSSLGTFLKRIDQSLIRWKCNIMNINDDLSFVNAYLLTLVLSIFLSYCIL